MLDVVFHQYTDIHILLLQKSRIKCPLNYDPAAITHTERYGAVHKVCHAFSDDF